MPVTSGQTRQASAHLSLTLDGKPCGFVESVAGGDISATVVASPAGPGGFAQKHIGQPVVEPFELEIGLGLEGAVYDWIAASWKRASVRKSGSVVTADADLQAIVAREFGNALLTETTFPTLDGSSKEPGHLTIRFVPETVRSTKASGKVAPAKNAKPFLTSNFRLELDGLDCGKVSGIDSFTVKQNVHADDIGATRTPTLAPGELVFPNLTVTIAEAGAGTWIDWFEDFVVKGNSDASKERTGAIVILDPSLKAELARVTLHNVGICALRHVRRPKGSTGVPKLAAELFCDRMELAIGGPRPAAGTPASPSVVLPPRVTPTRVIR